MNQVYRQASARRNRVAAREGWAVVWKWIGLVLLVLCATACQSVSTLPPVNLQAPGWTVREGQAVWHLPEGKTEIAGEVLVATRENGESFVQFTKSPFPLVNARSTPDRWEVVFPPQNRRYSGRGAPPTRLVWLYLPRVLSGEAPPRNWSWQQTPNGWRLANPATGEALEGYFMNGG